MVKDIQLGQRPQNYQYKLEKANIKPHIYDELIV